ncbi:hypothetical protein BCR39DRAFT_523756 [Naematelia encephala]|uniref:BTB domain-containing protein n=1 Tax=Naematelia encephala TaxID=71784 RepID=A0A1Y2BBS4_9TREE|nr:hypothetical protein BCR39DRAFT_523756 [Naematelia encephala]
MAASCSGSTSKTPQRPPLARNTTPTSKTRSFYSSKHSGSKAHLPQPKVLPFPDIPVRPVSRDGSRATSPTRLARTHSDHNIHDMASDGDHSGRGTPVLGFASSSTSPPVSSPLSGMNPTLSFNLAGPSRNRAQTGPSHASRPYNVSISSIASPSVATPIPISTPTRMEGFYPAPSPISLPTLSTSPLPTVQVTPGSLPTPTPAVRDPVRPPQPSKKLSNPPSPPPLAVPISATPSTQMLSEHMYQSFLKGTCADVRLWVRKWGVGWQVHRMVLVQAGFFHSLFTGGFSEMASGNSVSRKGKDKSIIWSDEEWQGDDVELQFDDPNITRAAFEICLSRLYSPYPHLHFPVALLPTPSQPLSPAFSATDSTPSLLDTQLSLPSSTILASPRLLLSLLATTIYLGHAALMRDVLAMVLRTIGPFTVGRYLAFAIGEGIGEEEWEGQAGEAARGMEAVGRRIRVRNDSMTSTISERTEPDIEVERSHEMPHGLSNRSSTSSEDGAKTSSSTTPMPQRQYSDAPTITHHPRESVSSTASRPSVASSSVFLENLPHFYGYASNKIGEACVCWLARWGADILTAEMAILAAGQESEMRIWAKGGIPAKFARAVLSSDHLFVKDEMERYRTARKVLDLRRKGWERETEGRGDLSLAESEEGEEEWEEDEAELGGVFAEGVYYTHMTFDDLSTIASDIDPTTSLPFVPLPILQAAHWSAADLRSRVITASVDPETSELELTQSTSEIAGLVSRRRRTPRSRLASPNTSHFNQSSFSSPSSPLMGQTAEQIYHPVPSDDTHRIGAGGLASFPSAANPSSLAGMPDLGPEDALPLEGRPNKTRPAPQGESTFFGLLTGSQPASAVGSTSLSTSLSTLGLSSLPTTSEQRWTKLEPLRFSVEFFNLESLPEKERAYSQTVFYAGSYFNVYVQTIRKKEKGTQLGIYLHRQNPGEIFPTPSAPGQVLGGEKVDDDVAFPQLARALSMPVVGVGSPGMDTVPLDGALREHGESRDVYMDTRRVTKAYFSISCSSALGTALLRFSSAPDSFTISQSWGWKSSALRSEEYLAGIAEGNGGLEEGVLGWTGERPAGKEGGLSACVVLGVV